MKIESNFKDYYDYLSGVYGIDEKIYYKRPTNNELKQFLSDKFLDAVYYYKTVALVINDEVHIGILDTRNKTFHWGDNINDIEELKPAPEKKLWVFHAFNYAWLRNTLEMQYDWSSKIECKRLIYGDFYGDVKMLMLPEFYKDGGKFAKKYNAPIVLLIDSKAFTNVSLNDINFNKYMNAHDVYLKITEFLTYKEPEPSKLSDKDKIISAGFDLKTSFRKM